MQSLLEETKAAFDMFSARNLLAPEEIVGDAPEYREYDDDKSPDKLTAEGSVTSENLNQCYCVKNYDDCATQSIAQEVVKSVEQIGPATSSKHYGQGGKKGN